MKSSSATARIPIQIADMAAAVLEAMFPINVHGWVALDRELDQDILKQAVLGVMREFPALAAKLRPGWLGAEFVPVECEEPPLKVADYDTIDPDSIPVPLLEFFNTPLDMLSGPLVSFCMVRAKDLAFLGVNVHHSACDGRGLRHLLAGLAAHYSALAAGKKPERPVFRTDRLPNVIYSQYSLTRRLRLILQGFRSLIPCFRYLHHDQIETNLSGSGTFTPVFFAGNESARIISKCKKLGITVNDLFLAALIRTYFRWNGKISMLTFLIPQDLRPWGVSAPGAYPEEGEWRTVGNLSGGFFFRLKGSDYEHDQERILALVHERVMAEKKAESALAFASTASLPVNLLPVKPLAAGLRRLSPGALVKGLGSTCFSNLGTVPSRQLKFGEANSIRFAFALPFIRGVNALFTAAGVGGSISFVITHPNDLDHQRLTALFKEELWRMVEK